MEGHVPSELKRKIIDWKIQFQSVFLLEVSGDYYVFKPLSKGQVRACQQLAGWAPEEVNDAIVDYGLLWPPGGGDSLEAGVHITLSEWIVSCSGFSRTEELKQLLEAERAQKQSLDHQYDAFLGTAFKMSPDQVDALNAFQLASLLARGETILQGEFKIFTDEELQKLQDRQRKLEDRKKRARDRKDERAKQEGKTVPRHQSPDKYIAPGGSPEEIQEVAESQERRKRSEEWLKKRGIKKKLLPPEVERLARQGVPGAVFVEDAEAAAVQYWKRQKHRSKSGVNFSNIKTHGNPKSS